MTVAIRTDLLNNIPKHLVGEGFEMPDAPSFGADLEKEYINKMKLIRKAAFDPKTGEKYEDSAHAQAVADYDNERHALAVKYSFAAYKTARELCFQCHRGLGFDDLFSVGFGAILNMVDKWAPFLGAKDKGTRFLTSVRVAIHNAVCRFLDDHNRSVKVPAYKTEQISVKLRSSAILYGKVKTSSNCKSHCKNCNACASLHTESCGRNKPGLFEQSILDLLRKVGLTPDDVDGKMSLGDIAIETGEYKAVAEIVNLDVASLISIIKPTTSIDIPVGDDGDESIADSVIATDYDSERQVFLRETLEEALNYIPNRNAEIIKDHFFNGLSVREVADKYNFSTVRATQMIKKSVNQIMASQTSMNILHHKIAGKC